MVMGFEASEDFRRHLNIDTFGSFKHFLHKIRKAKIAFIFFSQHELPQLTHVG